LARSTAPARVGGADGGKLELAPQSAGVQALSKISRPYCRRSRGLAHGMAECMSPAKRLMKTILFLRQIRDPTERARVIVPLTPAPQSRQTARRRFRHSGRSRLGATVAHPAGKVMRSGLRFNQVLLLRLDRQSQRPDGAEFG
jgi:hypothetical protein